METESFPAPLFNVTFPVRESSVTWSFPAPVWIKVEIGAVSETVTSSPRTCASVPPRGIFPMETIIGGGAGLA